MTSGIPRCLAEWQKGKCELCPSKESSEFPPTLGAFRRAEGQKGINILSAIALIEPLYISTRGRMVPFCPSSGEIPLALQVVNPEGHRIPMPFLPFSPGNPDFSWGSGK